MSNETNDILKNLESSDEFREYSKNLLVEEGSFDPEQADVFLSYIFEVPEDDSKAGLSKLIIGDRNKTVLSRHPRNALLNLKKMLFDSAGSVLDIVTGTEPMSQIISTLNVIKVFSDNMNVDLSEDHAKVVLWIYDKNHGKSWVSKSALEADVAKELKELALDTVLRDLEKLKAIEIQDKGLKTESIWHTEYLIIKSNAAE